MPPTPTATATVGTNDGEVATAAGPPHDTSMDEGALFELAPNLEGGEDRPAAGQANSEETAAKHG